MTFPVDCPEYLDCGHHWTKCAPGCPGWGGTELDLPWWTDLEAELIARGLISTPATRSTAGQSLDGAA